MKTKHKPKLVREYEIQIDKDGTATRLKEYAPLCGCAWDGHTMEFTSDDRKVDCRACLNRMPPPFLPVDAQARLTAMNVNDRNVLRGWFADTPLYADFVDYIDSLNADTMRRYGAAQKEEK